MTPEEENRMFLKDCIDSLEPLFIEDHANKTKNDARLLRVFLRTGEIPEEWGALAQLDC